MLNLLNGHLLHSASVYSNIVYFFVSMFIYVPTEIEGDLVMCVFQQDQHVFHSVDCSPVPVRFPGILPCISKGST